MDWYPWYFDIYSSNTMHLNPYQDGCYRRLIDHYMRSRRALPDNDVALARIIGESESNWVASAASVVRSFFVPVDGTLSHGLCNEILADQDKLSRTRSKTAKKAALKRWEQKRKSNMLELCSSDAQAMLGDATGQDRTIQKEKIYKKENFQKPPEVSETIWDDFVKHRKAKKAPVTETVLNLIRAEATKAGWTLEAALAETCARNWQGFKADWVTKTKTRSPDAYQGM